MGVSAGAVADTLAFFSVDGNTPSAVSSAYVGFETNQG
jgi:hypothetical protein